MKRNNHTLECTISFILATASLSCSNDMMALKQCLNSIPEKEEIMAIKEDMLATADTSKHFWFSDDVEFQSADPHAYWLMNRMMHTIGWTTALTSTGSVKWLNCMKKPTATGWVPAERLQHTFLRNRRSPTERRPSRCTQDSTATYWNSRTSNINNK